MRKVLILTTSMVFFSCASTNSSKKNNLEKVDYTTIYEKYGNSHFFGLGIGSGTNEQIAIKIAKSKALGELASSVKVTVMSKLEMISTAQETERDFSYDEKLKEQIISIGNATIRSPEYEILSLNQKKGVFEANVLAKKNIKDHFTSAGLDLDISNVNDLFNNLMSVKN